MVIILHIDISVFVAVLWDINVSFLRKSRTDIKTL